MAKQKWTLMISFEDRDSLMAFAKDVLPAGVAVYRLDPLDAEARGQSRSFVVRKRGAKPDAFLIDGEVR